MKKRTLFVSMVLLSFFFIQAQDVIIPKPVSMVASQGNDFLFTPQTRLITEKTFKEEAHLIAGYLNKEGAAVTLVEGAVTHTPRPKGVKVIKFLFYDELFEILGNELKRDYQIVIHAAAVSDYQPKNTYGSKISSQFSHIELNLIQFDQSMRLAEMDEYNNNRRCNVNIWLLAKVMCQLGKYEKKLLKNN